MLTEILLLLFEIPSATAISLTGTVFISDFSFLHPVENSKQFLFFKLPTGFYIKSFTKICFSSELSRMVVPYFNSRVFSSFPLDYLS